MAVDDRFQRKLRKGLFERDRRLTLADEDWLLVNEASPLSGVVGGDDKALSSAGVRVMTIKYFVKFKMRFHEQHSQDKHSLIRSLDLPPDAFHLRVNKDKARIIINHKEYKTDTKANHVVQNL